jgi:HEAT repeat protein
MNAKDPNALTPGWDYTDEEIRSFVGDLQSLQGGDLTVSLLVGCGARAIPPLREYLLEGQPQGIFQPRQRAVEALAQLGAKEVLLEYLSQKREIPDAVARFGEEAVENTAARALSKWRTDNVYLFLKDYAQKRMLSGVIEALGKFEREESAAQLIRALEDDVCRPTAEEALRVVAEKMKPLLLCAAHRESNEGEEKTSERQRRRSVLKILAEMSLTQQDWGKLQDLLHDKDVPVALTTALIAVNTSPLEEKQQAARFLIRSLGQAQWFLQMQIQDCLHRNYSSVRDVIAKEVVGRRRLAQGEALSDPVLRILVYLQSTAADSPEGMEGHGFRTDAK